MKNTEVDNVRKVKGIAVMRMANSAGGGLLTKITNWSRKPTKKNRSNLRSDVKSLLYLVLINFLQVIRR